MTAKKSVGPIVGAVLVILVAVGAAFWGITTRARALAVVTRETRELAVPTVAVAMPDRGSPQEEIALPGNMQAFADASIYARTNGYLKRWYVDIGAHVRAGQTLAEIETPEVDQQLQQSRSNLATAQANLKLAEITKNRYQGLLATHAVAQQDVDNAVGTYNAN